MFPHLATHAYCTLGGNIRNNSCGAHTVMGGKTVDNIEELNILTYDGLRMRVGATDDDTLDLIRSGGGRRAEIYSRLKELADRYADEIRRRYPQNPRRVSGYNLDDLLPEKGFDVGRSLVGSEGTCALTLAATLRLLPWPAKRALLVLGYPDIARAADDVGELRGLGPDALEAFDGHVVENMKRKGKPVPGERLLPQGHAWLLVEFGGDEQKEANDKAEKAYARLKKIGTHASDMRLIEPAEEQAKIWNIRENGVGSSHIPGVEDAWPSWEDAAVPPERLGDYLREFNKLNERFGYTATLFGHFGDGCVHARMTFGLKTKEGVARFREYMQEASDLCLKYGGSLSGEHGDGQAKGELLPKMFGPELIQAFREFKTIWDPHWRMNPGKVIDAQSSYLICAWVRIMRPDKSRPISAIPTTTAASHRPPSAVLASGSAAASKARQCVRGSGQAEEMHSTRGRAHLLFEMMRGDPLDRGWQEEGVREALDLCLQCKGCKHDCPVSVDMATYKAEFLAHDHRGRMRPRSAYSMGLVMWWARLAMLAPGWVNLAGMPGIGDALKAAAGFTTEREAPAFAEESFQTWFQRQPKMVDGSRPPVILWPDTFNNYFFPNTAKSAVRVLEAAGYAVRVPEQPLCCGRPLYDYGRSIPQSGILRRLSRPCVPRSVLACRSSVSSPAVCRCSC